MNPEDVRALVVLRMQEADEALSDVRLLLREGPGTRSAVSRAYYAAFYAVLALLQTVGEVPKKHKGAIALFDRIFVKTNRMPTVSSKWLHRLFKARVQDDYERTEPVPIERAMMCLDAAEHFVREVRDYLAREGFLSQAKD